MAAATVQLPSCRAGLAMPPKHRSLWEYEKESRQEVGSSSSKRQKTGDACDGEDSDSGSCEGTSGHPE